MSILGGAAAYITTETMSREDGVLGVVRYYPSFRLCYVPLKHLTVFEHIGNQLDKMQGMRNVSVSGLSIQRIVFVT